MANEKVSFKSGLKSKLPAASSSLTGLIAFVTDTGELFVYNTGTSRMTVKTPTVGALTLTLGSTSQGAWDGSSAKSITINPSAIGALSKTAIQLTDEDLNDIKVDIGFYYARGGNSVTNTPPGLATYGFGMRCERLAGGYYLQTLSSSGLQYKRFFREDGWSDWQPVYSGYQKPTPTDIGVIGTAPTSGQVAVFDGTTGKIKSTGFTINASVPSGAKFTDTTYSAASGGGLSLSGTAFSIANSGVTASSYGTSSSKTLSFGGTFVIPYITVNAKGQLTAASSITLTMPTAPTSVSGNAGTATKLQTARTISLSGAVSGSTSFDGSENKSITTTLRSNEIVASETQPSVHKTGDIWIKIIPD